MKTMSAHVAPPDLTGDGLVRDLAEAAAQCDFDGSYPHAAMKTLVARGLTGISALLPDRRRSGMLGVLALLAEVGRGDASVGRLYEGHANALELIDRLAPGPMQARVYQAVAAGKILGVWGADPPENRLQALPDGAGLRLHGSKIYCSGADGIDLALVLADGPDESRSLLLVPVTEDLKIDRRGWRPLGMRASGSHRVDFEGVVLDAANDVVCDGSAYLADPWFSAGAMRFAAVQAGVARGLAEVAAAQLSRQGRSSAPHQADRLGHAAAAIAGLEGILAAAAAAWDAGCGSRASYDAKAQAAAYGGLARVAAERTLLEVADLVQRAVGLGGLLAPHPLEQRLRDALTYVRQPNPDGAREAVGRAFASGHFPAFQR